MNEMEPGDLASALSKIPLFREVQRLLFSQTGPVNWEIARQIARAVAQAGEPVAIPGPEERAAFDDACRISEIQVAGCTGLEPPTTLARAEILDRAAWADINLDGFRHLIDRLALRLQGELHKEKTPALGLRPFLDAIGPFLLGLEVGFLVGYLSRRVLGQYDLCLPRGDAGRLYFVYPNITVVERELEVDPAQFRLWVALHEVTHRLEFESVPWVRSHFVGLVERFVDAAELDPSEVTARLSSLANPDELQRLLAHPEELLPMLMSPAQKQLVGEIQAVMSVLEGYAEWAMDEVGRELLPEFSKMREGINRRRAERSLVERLLARLLGLDLKLEQYRAGERFIRAVAAADQLPRLWEGAQNLPTLEETKEPAKWLARVAFA
jgi:coenzyme F420 biosynthesis associated uncharacterized protein